MPPAITIWLLEDQLSLELDPLSAHADAPVLLIESRRAFRKLPYHKKRLTFLISALRHFVDDLRAINRTVHHYALHDEPYRDSLAALRNYIEKTGCRRFVMMEPSEYHTKVWLATLPALLGIEIDFFPNTLFLTDLAEFRAWVRPLTNPVMETFYRRSRVRFGVLMEGKLPAGGKWNLDAFNRRPPDPRVVVPPRKTFPPDVITRRVIADVEEHFGAHYGKLAGFDLAVSRADALVALTDFLDQRLPLFGLYEDAMRTGEPLMFHSMLSPLINAGLLRPLEVVRAAEARYRSGQAPLNAVEGFCRQIIGWREYVYGIYWSFMPEYGERNTRRSTRPLPNFFWTAETDLNCLKQTIAGVIDHAYSHHIQRLMILCNFATLVGLNPQSVNDWFLTMYVDSHDWVMVPNVIGMGLNADAVPGIKVATMATKPYVSSAAYIDRMSDYCDTCRYDSKKRTGDDACPFNALYWTFLHHWRKDLDRVPRMTMITRNLDKIEPADMREMMDIRKRFIKKM